MSAFYIYVARFEMQVVHLKRQAGRQAERQECKRAQTEVRIEGRIDMQADIQAERQTFRQTDRVAEWVTYAWPPFLIIGEIALGAVNKVL